MLALSFLQSLITYNNNFKSQTWRDSVALADLFRQLKAQASQPLCVVPMHDRVSGEPFKFYPLTGKGDDHHGCVSLPCFVHGLLSIHAAVCLLTLIAIS